MMFLDALKTLPTTGKYHSIIDFLKLDMRPPIEVHGLPVPAFFVPSHLFKSIWSTRPDDPF
jgi:hypothetical protein